MSEQKVPDGSDLPPAAVQGTEGDVKARQLEKELADVLKVADAEIAELKAKHKELADRNAFLEGELDGIRATAEMWKRAPDDMVPVFRAISDQCDGKNSTVTQHGEIYRVELPGPEVARLLPLIKEVVSAADARAKESR